MWQYIIWTVVIFPLYLTIRWSYFKLPIGPDAGFYISNNTIVNKKINFSKGWNAHYAACSKLIVEYFYSLIYLWFGKKRYKLVSRFVFSIYNYITAIGVGAIVYYIADKSLLAFILGLVVYALVSSEPHYGIYFESGDQFETLFMTFGSLLLIIGLPSQNIYLLSMGLGIWFLNAYLIKITSLSAAIILCFGIIMFVPEMLFPSIIIILCTSSLYMFIINFSGQAFTSFYRSALRHEISYCKRISFMKKISLLMAPFVRILQKTKQTIRIMLINPLIPALAIFGLCQILFIISPEIRGLLGLCFLAIIIKFYVSLTPIWYYNIPFLPYVASLAAIATLKIIQWGQFGIIFLTLLLLIWIYINIIKVFIKDKKILNDYVWKIQSRDVGTLNYVLENICLDLQKIVKQSSLFIYGLTQQPYLLLGTGYVLPFPNAASFVANMDGNFMNRLNRSLFKIPPDYIFEMFNTCNLESLYNNLGLRYEKIGNWQQRFNLYKFIRREAVEPFFNFNCLRDPQNYEF